MKNRINIKSVRVLAIFMMGTLLLVAACSENKPTDTKELAEERNNTWTTVNEETREVDDYDADTRFLMDAAEMQLEEISLGRLAQEKGTASHVKDLGKAMETDHTKSLATLRTLAQTKSVAIPATVTDDSKDAYKKLNEKTGDDFDKAYSAQSVGNHENAIEMFEKASKEATDPDIRALATNTLPTLKSHLQHAEKCKLACEKSKS